MRETTQCDPRGRSPAAVPPPGLQELRAPVLALRAFNAETALIGEHAKSEPLVMMRCQVREAAAGSPRPPARQQPSSAAGSPRQPARQQDSDGPTHLLLATPQWWRDAVNAAYKGPPPEQPVATALAAALAGGAGLTRYRLQRMVTTREEDLLRAGPPPSLAALEAYGEGTASQLLYLQMEAAGLASVDADHAASHLGKALGIAAVLRGTQHHAQRCTPCLVCPAPGGWPRSALFPPGPHSPGRPPARLCRRRTYLPQDLCQKHGVSEEDILGGRASSALQDVTLEVAAAAKVRDWGAGRGWKFPRNRVAALAAPEARA